MPRDSVELPRRSSRDDLELPRRSSRDVVELPADFDEVSKSSQIRWPNVSPRCMLQFAVLAALSLQNTVGILINSAAMKPPENGVVMWNTQSGVIYQEVFKTLTSICLLLAGGERLSAVWASSYEVMRSSVPGLCYLLQNNLTYIAVAHLDPAVFAVTQKLRILFAAMLTVFVLGAEVGCFRWAALVFLCVGVGCVQFALEGKGQGGAAQSLQAEKDSIDQMRGLTATFGASFISALAGVYCEKILKDSDTSIWVRNVHFSTCGVVLGVAGLAITGELGQVFSDGLFAGYHALIWVAVVNNGVGGILVSLAIKHVDVVASNFSQTVALIFISLFSVMVLGKEANSFFIIGVLIVCSATFMYAMNPSYSALQAHVAKLPAQANVRTLIIILAVTGSCIFVSQGMLSVEAGLPTESHLAMPWESHLPEGLPTLQPGIVITRSNLGSFSQVDGVLGESLLESQGANTEDKVRLRASGRSLTSVPLKPEGLRPALGSK